MNNKKQTLDKSRELADALRHVLSEIESNGYANSLTLKNAITSWSAWETNLKQNDTVGFKYEITEKIQVIKYPRYNSIDGVNPSAIISALKKNRNSIELLLSLKRQQLVAQDDVKSNTNMIIKLLRQGFIEEYVLCINGRLLRYYTLSTKGLLVFDNHNINVRMRNHFISLSVPAWLKSNCDKDSRILPQAAIINEFFKKNKIYHYLTFEFEAIPGLLLANEIAEDRTNMYYCVFGIDANMDVNNIVLLNNMINEGVVKKIAIICIDNMVKRQVSNIMKTKAIKAEVIEMYSLEDINE